MPLKITLTDYGVGNLYSIKRSLENCGAEVTVTSDMSVLKDAECIVFPGVGAFDKTMERLEPYRSDVQKMAENGTPMLGICIGMQIMFEKSAEGTVPGLGIYKGEVIPVKAEVVPHMGWNEVTSSDALMDGVPDNHFYFAHSYRAEPKDSGIVIGTTDYGEKIPVFFREFNVYGTQFHPEKSSSAGMAFLKNFISFAEGCL